MPEFSNCFRYFTCTRNARSSNLWNDLLGADTDGDKTLSTGEFSKIWEKNYDILGDGRAPHSGGWFDKGAAMQQSLAKLITRH